MKKVMFILAAVCMTAAANARILRVSNVSGSSAPYASIDAAHDDAKAGDTIMIDGSSAKYGGDYGRYDITKRLVIIGPGYWLVDNGVIAEGANSASIVTLNLKTDNIVVKGLVIRNLNITGAKAVVNRCHIGEITFESGADNGIVSQCYITGTPSGANYIQMTNNIFTSTTSYALLSGFKNSYIAYNTFRNKNVQLSGVTNTTIEHNIWKEVKNSSTTNSLNNNYETDIINTQATADFIDNDYFSLEIPTDVINTYGAFAGDSPYILSGVPSGPVILDLDVPTTVELGSKLNVTVKIGMVK